MKMSREEKKALLQKYKEMKPPMGVFIIKNNSNTKVFIQSSKDTRSSIGRHKFELGLGSHKNKELQKDWNKFGEEAFSFEVLELLKYDEKEEEKDYSEDLEILKMMWIEKLNNNGILEVYQL